MMPLCERAIEAVHANLKRCVCNATYVLPPFICAKMREQRHLDLLRSNMSFQKFVMDNWRKRRLLDLILEMRYTTAELQSRTYAEKVGLVYQCSLDAEFEDMTIKTASQAIFRAAIAGQQPIARPKPPSTIVAVNYLRSVFIDNDFF